MSVRWWFLPLLLLPLSLLWATAPFALERERRGLTDDLTGLANRTGLARGSAAVCLIDLDRFKEVNDTLGHTVGDRLLQAISGAWRGRVATPTWLPGSGAMSSSSRWIPWRRRRWWCSG